MIQLVAFDLDGTLAISKQAIKESMGLALTQLLRVAHVAIISGGDWPQFSQQIVTHLPSEADLSKLWLMPTSGTKLYRATTNNSQDNSTPSSSSSSSNWQPIFTDLFSPEVRLQILHAFDASLTATGFQPTQTWGPRIEDRGSQITFSALGQDAPISEKQSWDPDFAKRKVIQADLQTRLPDLSINMGGTTSIDVTKKGVDKAYGLKKLSRESGVALEEMMFVGDAIFPGGNDYPAKQLGLRTVQVENPEGTLAAIAAVVACLS